jgi:acyl-coenzyme A synthetase/AMP-(fatty) acid ligase
MIEPAFFYGAMYSSYALTVALGVAVFALSHIFFDPSMWDIIIALTITLVLGSPMILRVSRIMWMNIFIKYDPEKRGANLK